MSMSAMPPQLRAEIGSLDLEIVTGRLSALTITSSVTDNIKEKQDRDDELQKIKEGMQEGKHQDFRVDDQEVLYLGTRHCVPNDIELRKQLMTEAHNTPYALRPGATKMYHNLRSNFWWSGMKRDVAKYVQSCLTCQQVKAEYQRPRGELQLI